MKQYHTKSPCDAINESQTRSVTPRNYYLDKVGKYPAKCFSNIILKQGWATPGTRAELGSSSIFLLFPNISSEKHELLVGTPKKLVIDFCRFWHPDRKRLPTPGQGIWNGRRISVWNIEDAQNGMEWKIVFYTNYLLGYTVYIKTYKKLRSTTKLE